MTQQAFHPQLAAMMKESELQFLVMELARTLRCRAFHPLPAMLRSDRWVTATMGDKGWLDVTIVGKRGALFRELETLRNNPTPEQYAWLRAWTVAGFDAAVWTPAHWFSGRIEQEIRAIA